MRIRRARIRSIVDLFGVKPDCSERLVIKQMVVNPIMNYPSNDLARHLEQHHLSVVVAVLAITLPFPEKDNKAPLPVSWDDA